MMLNGLRKIRVAQRQQRALLQVESKEAEPQSAERDGQNNIQPRGHSAGSEFRTRHPEEIDETHEDEPDGDFRKHFCVALHILREEQEKRHEEMEHQHDHRDDAPAAVQPRAIEADFFRLVTRPDDQELREIEIRPEHHESEEQFPQVMQVALLQDAGERLSARQKYDDRDHEGHRGNQLPGYEKEPVNGGGPVRRQRHHPIDGREGHDKNVENNAGAGKHFEAETQSAVFGVGVLLLGQNIEDEHQRQPNSEVDDCTSVKASLSEVAFLKIRERTFASWRRVEPALLVSMTGIEILHSENRNGQKGAAISGSARVADSSGRRMMMPQWPLVRCCNMTRPSEPTVKPSMRRKLIKYD